MYELYNEKFSIHFDNEEIINNSGYLKGQKHFNENKKNANPDYRLKISDNFSYDVVNEYIILANDGNFEDINLENFAELVNFLFDIDATQYVYMRLYKIIYDNITNYNLVIDFLLENKDDEILATFHKKMISFILNEGELQNYVSENFLKNKWRIIPDEIKSNIKFISEYFLKNKWRNIPDEIKSDIKFISEYYPIDYFVFDSGYGSRLFDYFPDCKLNLIKSSDDFNFRHTTGINYENDVFLEIPSYEYDGCDEEEENDYIEQHETDIDELEDIIDTYSDNISDQQTYISKYKKLDCPILINDICEGMYLSNSIQNEERSFLINSDFKISPNIILFKGLNIKKSLAMFKILKSMEYCVMYDTLEINFYYIDDKIVLYILVDSESG